MSREYKSALIVDSGAELIRPMSKHEFRISFPHAFEVRQIVTAPLIAECFVILDIQTAGKSQLLSSGPMPAVLLNTADLALDTLPPGLEFYLHVQNLSMAALRYTASICGVVR